MKKLLILITLISFASYPQEGMVLIQNKPVFPDSLTEATYKEFVAMAEDHLIDYETHLIKLKEVHIIDAHRSFVSGFDNGSITLNSRLNKFPYSKRVAMLQELTKLCGGNIDDENRSNVLSNFYVTDKTEEDFRKQKKYRSTLYTIRKHLEEVSPLRRKK